MKTSTRTNLVWTALVAGLTLVAGCDILDVENPNNVVQADVEKVEAAGAMVNGSLGTVSRALGEIASLSGTSSDELTWIGSRDGWGQLNQGRYGDPRNEFTDASFPFVGEARWMSDEALAIVEGHVADGVDMGNLHPRALLYAASMYVFIAEAYDDFVFSDRTVPGEPIGQANMSTLFDTAITRLTEALSLASDNGLRMEILGMRARANFSKAVRASIKGGGSALINNSAAIADAQAFLNIASADQLIQYEYSGATVFSDVGSWVNNRSEMQFGLNYIDFDEAEPSANLGTSLMDPIDGIVDPALDAIIKAFETDDWPELTIFSSREAHLILAEGALAGSDMGGFTTHINNLRALDGLTAYSGQMDARDLLEHSRQANMFMQVRRLQDMYRFGITDPEWVSNPTPTLFPIAQTEIEANPNVSG